MIFLRLDLEKKAKIQYNFIANPTCIDVGANFDEQCFKLKKGGAYVFAQRKNIPTNSLLFFYPSPGLAKIPTGR